MDYRSVAGQKKRTVWPNKDWVLADTCRGQRSGLKQVRVGDSRSLCKRRQQGDTLNVVFTSAFSLKQLCGCSSSYTFTTKAFFYDNMYKRQIKKIQVERKAFEGTVPLERQSDHRGGSLNLCWKEKTLQKHRDAKGRWKIRTRTQRQVHEATDPKETSQQLSDTTTSQTEPETL